MVSIAIMALSSFVTTWLARGQGTAQLTDLTGRTKVWRPLLAFPRDRFQEIFGFGLSNSSFNGLPIDSNWLASYEEQGLFGVVVCAAILLFLLVAAYFQPRGVQRALALFLVTYCLVASFTEVGFTDASMYLLELTLAASLLVPCRPGPEPGMSLDLIRHRWRPACPVEGGRLDHATFTAAWLPGRHAGAVRWMLVACLAAGVVVLSWHHASIAALLGSATPDHLPAGTLCTSRRRGRHRLPRGFAAMPRSCEAALHLLPRAQ